MSLTKQPCSINYGLLFFHFTVFNLLTWLLTPLLSLFLAFLLFVVFLMLLLQSSCGTGRWIDHGGGLAVGSAMTQGEKSALSTPN